MRSITTCSNIFITYIHIRVYVIYVYTITILDGNIAKRKRLKACLKKKLGPGLHKSELHKKYQNYIKQPGECPGCFYMHGSKDCSNTIFLSKHPKGLRDSA